MQLPATLVDPVSGNEIEVDTATDYVTLRFAFGYRLKQDSPPSPQASTSTSGPPPPPTSTARTEAPSGSTESQ